MTHAENLQGHAVVQTKQALYVPTVDEILQGPNIRLIEPSAIWNRYPADFVVNLSGRDISHHLTVSPPMERHATYFSEFRDIELFGHHHLHAVITAKNWFSCQDISGYQRRLNYHVNNHPGRELAMPQITGRDDKFFIDRSQLADAAVTKITESVFFATPTEPLNWGMWLLQALPAAVFFLKEKPAERFMTYAGTAWQQQFLRTIGLSESQLMHQELGATYHCERLTMLQYSAVDLVPTPREKEIYDKLTRTLAPDAKTNAGRRIFLSRRSITHKSQGKYRALTNEAEVVAMAERLNFEIHEPETMTFADQIKLFRESSVVVGLGGAALFNVVFCKPGTTVVSIESSNSFVHNHAALFASLGHKYGFIFGCQDVTDTAPVHKRWSIDVDGLLSVLRGL